MSSETKQKLATFFPQRRCEIKLNAGGTGLLADKRVTLACVMMMDGSLVGFPGWLSAEYDLVSKEDSSTAKTANDAQLEGVEVSIFANDTQKEPALKIQNCSIQGFKFARGKTKNNGALGPVALSFTISTMSFNKLLYDLIPDYIANTFFLEFSGTQMTISFGRPTEADQEEVSEDSTQANLPGTVVAAAAPSAKAEAPKETTSKRRSPAAEHAAAVMEGKASTGKGKAASSAVN